MKENSVIYPAFLPVSVLINIGCARHASTLLTSIFKKTYPFFERQNVIKTIEKAGKGEYFTIDIKFRINENVILQ